MKRIIFAIVGLVWIASAQAQQLNTLKDSVAYCIGMELSSIIRQFDTTLNVSIVVQALEQKMAGRAVISDREAGETMNRYMSHLRMEQVKQQNEQNKSLQAKAEAQLSQFAAQQGVLKSASGLLYKIEQIGGSKLPQDGDVVTVHYTLKDAEGNVLDSSYDRGEPMSFTNLDGEMIPGFLEGVRMLGQGGKATLYLPPALGYGEHGYGEIKPHSVLIFEVELLVVTSKSKK